MKVTIRKRAEIFFEAATMETVIAVKKFPQPNQNLAALMEEVGELAQAFLQGEEPYRIYAEAKQVAAMACRIALEGDPQFPQKMNRAGRSGRVK